MRVIRSLVLASMLLSLMCGTAARGQENPKPRPQAVAVTSTTVALPANSPAVETLQLWPEGQMPGRV
ncbi:MAG: hypothetical protein KDA45_15140, partial [Planctomycetales bacterium]|nr:hypothetical protein [Planctomycetales bacterium]